MKKIFFLVPLWGLLFSCAEDKKQNEITSEEQLEVIEESTQNLDEVIHTSEFELEKNQNEIDSLLINI